MSGVAGPVGAAAAAGRLLGLDPSALRSALTIAAAQAAGTQEALGTMTKPLHLGKAAANGVEAALLAQAGLIRRRTKLTAIADCRGLRRERTPTSGLSSTASATRWEIERNSFKPYACGVVSHAAIDAGDPVAAAAATGSASNESRSVRTRSSWT